MQQMESGIASISTIVRMLINLESVNPDFVCLSPSWIIAWALGCLRGFTLSDVGDAGRLSRMVVKVRGCPRVSPPLRLLGRPQCKRCLRVEECLASRSCSALLHTCPTLQRLPRAPFTTRVSPKILKRCFKVF